MSVPHLLAPFTLNPDGSLATLEQDTVDEVAQCVAVVLGTVEGSRLAVPELGIADPTFLGVGVGDIEAAVSTWEPRATLTISPAVPPTNQIQITVTVATQGDT